MSGNDSNTAERGILEKTSGSAVEKGSCARGMVYLVGAGPGDPGLITLKGLQCLARADVIIYDRLVSSSLLTYASPRARLIYAGKGPGSHALTQEEINHLLLKFASEELTVTRLKGGDPFLFGRGGEEAEFLAEHHIPFEVVPGVTSAIAAPAYAGIPVTHREYTSTFAVITGHEEPGKNREGIAWEKIATGIGTLVFLMGAANLPLIVQKLLESGRSPRTPAALIYRGTSPEQRVLTASLGEIAAKARALNFQPPFVTVVGEVTALREKLSWSEKRPFFGKRIVVTRPRDQAAALMTKIQELGGEAFPFPTIEIVPPRSYALLDKALAELRSYSWIIFTSANGVKFFLERLRDLRRDIRELAGIRLCAIGPCTREALEERGLLVDYVPAEYRAEAIADGLAEFIRPGEKVLLPRAAGAREILPEKLASLGAVVHSAEAYRTALPGEKDVALSLFKELLAEKRIHAVLFTSSSTVRNFVELLTRGEEKESYLKEALQGVTLAAIGPVTAETARQEGLTIDVQAAEYTADGLLKALQSFFGV